MISEADRDHGTGERTKQSEPTRLDILETHGNDDLARVHIGRFTHGFGAGGGGGAGPGTDGARLVEFVESLQPPLSREQKWVLIVSSLFGCPVNCPMCDAGGDYRGRLSAGEILAQIDAMVYSRYPDGRVPSRKFKVQFARMGEPAFNPAVLEVLRELPDRYHAPGLIPCISTVAPRGSEDFFEQLAGIKDEHYGGGRFQLQFSVHSTDPGARADLIPVKKWGLDEMAAFGGRWWRDGDRKITLNFAAVEGRTIDTGLVRRHFDPARFLVKLTPLNPTVNADAHSLVSKIDGHRPESARALVEAFEGQGFQVLLSIGEMEENHIGSNCGQYVRAMRE